MSKALTIGDLHLYAEHPAYMAFCCDLYEQWDCDQVVFIGDVVDHHAVSFHAANPQCPGPEDEYQLTLAAIQKWHKVFPEAKVALGNHDLRILRLAESVKIPKRYIKDFSEVWKTPNWDWDYEFLIDDVVYFHGEGASGVHPAWNAITKKMKSVVMGHCHARAGVKWMTTRNERFFGMDTGCGICSDAWQFVYGKNHLVRPFIAAGVIIDGHPYSEAMPCGPKEKYHRSRF